MPLTTGDPESIGGYVLVDRLGSGGMGVVFLGLAASGRQVAVKIVHAQLAEDEEFRARFRQEVAAARRVSGAFTAPVVDADPDAERPWMATLYVPGPTLAEVVEKQGPLNGKEVRTLGLGLAEALHDIHQAGVVHRDLKPANVLMAEDGPRVIDFGISRAADNQALTMTGRVMGTPPFMSPEQLRSPREVTPATDVFSLGSLLVYAVTGAGPFDADTPYMTGYQVMYEPPRLDQVPEPLRGIAERCLDKSPAARPDMAELHRMLQTLPDSLTTDSGQAGAPVVSSGEVQDPGANRNGGGAGPTPRTGRRRVRLILTVLGAALAVTGLLVTTGLLVPTGGSQTTSGTARPRPVSLPDGWRPWQTVLGHEGSQTPSGHQESGCVSDDTSLYCGGEGFTVAKVDAATGRILWRAGNAPHNQQPIGVRDGLVHIYENAKDSVRRVVALDADTKERKWEQSVSLSIPASLYGDGLLTLSAQDTELVAYGPDGDVLWESPTPQGLLCHPLVSADDPYALCTPYEPGDGPYTLLRLDPDDGSAHALASLPRKAVGLGAVGGQPLFLAPETAEDVYESGYERPYNALLRVDPDSGRLSRTALSRPQRGSATLLNGVVYFVRTNGTVTAVSASSGEQLWQTTTETENLSAPMESKRGGRLYFANRFGRLLALDGATGAELWRTAALDDPGDAAQDTPPGVLLVKDAIVAVAGNTVFSVHPDRPAAQ
ncbi:PQQ-binding-like beta-propeller repeat protein [Streptomyces sp. NPDC059862]|uniref:serine/threonine-protein kinase n=1 Tax=Streptomyces sp. NPDC059862 TaxID=3346975 RepID=UPI003661C2AA